MDGEIRRGRLKRRQGVRDEKVGGREGVRHREREREVSEREREREMSRRRGRRNSYPKK